jgi:acetate kinase
MHTPSRLLLTINGGSSSIKFALFEAGPEIRRAPGGEVSGIGTPSMTLTDDRGERDVGPGGVGTHADAVRAVMAWLDTRLEAREVDAIVHRVVHGGDVFVRTQVITSDLLEGLRRLIPLAPNHLPDEIALIEACAAARPTTRHIACFDTAFHHALPEVSRTLAVPRSPGLRRYGFHGLSYAYLVSELARTDGPLVAGGRLILAHLGNGASLAAVRDSRPIDTSMGLTPMGGLVMSSRAGDLDPGVVTYLARERHLDASALERMLALESGLQALAGESDMRTLLAREAGDPRARLAVDVFCHQARKWIGAFAASLDGVDTIVFTGGIGEHAPVIRARICAGLGFLGVVIDDAANGANAAVISSPSSRVRVRVIATDEALMMAREAVALLAATNT